ncbi:MAG: hypothetical protein M5U08_11195 [Burkholderiales bacterium]|nr:hypothetical protein [Burkholderiales bacterium]
MQARSRKRRHDAALGEQAGDEGGRDDVERRPHDRDALGRQRSPRKPLAPAAVRASIGIPTPGAIARQMLRHGAAT